MGKQKYVDCWTYPKPVLDEKLGEIKKDVSDVSGQAETLSESLDDLSRDFEGLSGSVETLAETTETINENIADSYDAAATYSVGDLCIYENALYKCTTAIETAEEWTAGHWAQTNIADEISIDAAITLITSRSAKFTIDNSNISKKCAYTIRNKVCYVNLYLHCVSPSAEASEEVCDMPNMVANMGRTVNFLLRDFYSASTLPALIQDGKLYVRGGTANTDYSACISYPID